MNRNKVYAKSKENQIIIKALNMYGRVPETWELLEQIERLNNIINELEKRLEQAIEDNKKEYSLKSQMAVFVLRDTLELIEELKGSE